VTARHGAGSQHGGDSVEQTKVRVGRTPNRSQLHHHPGHVCHCRSRSSRVLRPELGLARRDINGRRTESQHTARRACRCPCLLFWWWAQRPHPGTSRRPRPGGWRSSPRIREPVSRSRSGPRSRPCRRHGDRDREPGTAEVSESGAGAAPAAPLPGHGRLYSGLRQERACHPWRHRGLPSPYLTLIITLQHQIQATSPQSLTLPPSNSPPCLLLNTVTCPVPSIHIFSDRGHVNPDPADPRGRLLTLAWRPEHHAPR